MNVHAGMADSNGIQAPAAAARSRLARTLGHVCADIHADRYMLVEPAHDRGSKSLRIVASNWVFDALEDLGRDGIFRIVESGLAVSAGESPRPLHPARADFLSPAERHALAGHGHAELYCQKVAARDGFAFVLFSAELPGRMDPAAAMRAHMVCGYALARYHAQIGERAARDPLSDRERECLRWVSEGKTTDEVAVILGVSSNTVNSYVAHAIQKFGASNRAMAIAAAIRSGII